nr:proline-rich receptor-like protein kinase PERK9 [Aegilops tauschii subsp. strangulata]
MSSPPPNPSLPLPVTSSPPATTTTVAPLLPAPGFSVAPAPAVLTPEEVSGALWDLTQAVQEIHLFLAGSYGPHLAAPPIAATAPPWLLWQPPHLAAFAALARPLQLPSTATTAPPWLPWQPPHPARHRSSRCSCSSHRRSAPAPHQPHRRESRSTRSGSRPRHPRYRPG